MLTLGQRADQPAALRASTGPGSAASRTSAYRNSPISRRRSFHSSVLPALSFTSAGPSQLTAPPPRGDLVLPNSTPARQHATRSATDPPARTATPTPWPRPRSPPTRPRSSLPAGSTAPSSGSSTTAHRVKCALIRSARSANRRSQPRTVPVHPQPSGDLPIPLASDASPRSPHRSPTPRPADATTRPRQQHMRARAAPAPRPPRPQQPIPDRAAQHPLPSRAPTAPTPPDTTDNPAARRPAQPRPAPARRIRSTSGATSGIQRALPTNGQADGRALARSRTHEACQPRDHDERHHHPRR